MRRAVRVEPVQIPSGDGEVIRHRAAVEPSLGVTPALIHPNAHVLPQFRQVMDRAVGVDEGEPTLHRGDRPTATTRTERRCHAAHVHPLDLLAVRVEADDVADEHVDEPQSWPGGVPDGAFAMVGEGGGELVGGDAHVLIHPASTIHRCPVQERLSSAASQSTIRATSSG